MIKICLDAGHYGKYNRSPANKAYYESEMNWKLHLFLKKYLEQYGCKVITTRNNQATDLDLYDRGYSSKGCDLFLSLHSNAVGSGVREDIDYPVAYAAVSGKADRIATLLTQCVHEIMGTADKPRIEHRRGQHGDYYGVVRGATAAGVPGLILEHSFHTNTRSTNWLLDESNLDRLARAEAQVIAEYFGQQGTLPPAKPEPQWKPTGTATCTGNDVLVRATPGGAKIGSLGKGNRFEVDGQKSGSWVRVKVAGIGIGWVHENYVKYDKTQPVAPSKPPTAAPEYPWVGKCTGNSVNVRKGPGRGYGLIKNWPKLNKGNLFDVLGKEGAWYRIRIAGKYEGYISENYVARA